MALFDIKVEGCGVWDGSYVYDLDPQRLTGTELHLIKLRSGVRLGELFESLRAGDYDLIVCLTVFAIIGAGRASRDQAGTLFDELMELPLGGGITMTLQADPEADAGPPAAGDGSPEPPQPQPQPPLQIVSAAPSVPSETSTTSAPSSN